MRRLMIADSSVVMVSALEAALGQQFEIVTCSDGEDAGRILEQFQPDILILNLMLPHKDGLMVLQETKYRPKIILALTPYLSPYVQSSVQRLGIDFTMLSPSINALCTRLQDLIAGYRQPPKGKDPQEVTAHHLHVLGFTTRRSGYRQLCAAIPLYARDPDQLITKELYPEIAKLCDAKSGQRVEHAIRGAIKDAWHRMDRVVWYKYFPPGPDGEIPCPTNREFISRLAALLDTH